MFYVEVPGTGPHTEKALGESFYSGHLQEKPLSGVGVPRNADTNKPQKLRLRKVVSETGRPRCCLTEEAQTRERAGVHLLMYVTNLRRCPSFKNRIYNITAQSSHFPQGNKGRKILWPQLSDSDVYLLGPFPQGGGPIRLDFLKLPRPLLPQSSSTLLKEQVFMEHLLVAVCCFRFWGHKDGQDMPLPLKADSLVKEMCREVVKCSLISSTPGVRPGGCGSSWKGNGISLGKFRKAF